MYGHVEKLAEAIKKGAASVEGVDVKLWQVIDALYFLMFYSSWVSLLASILPVICLLYET